MLYASHIIGGRKINLFCEYVCVRVYSCPHPCVSTYVGLSEANPRLLHRSIPLCFYFFFFERGPSPDTRDTLIRKDQLAHELLGSCFLPLNSVVHDTVPSFYSVSSLAQTQVLRQPGEHFACEPFSPVPQKLILTQIFPKCYHNNDHSKTSAKGIGLGTIGS